MLNADRAYTTVSSVLYDAVAVIGGPDSARTLSEDGAARHFVLEAYKHHKPILLVADGRSILDGTPLAEQLPASFGSTTTPEGVTVAPALDEESLMVFLRQVGLHRHWDRETAWIPA